MKEARTAEEDQAQEEAEEEELIRKKKKQKCKHEERERFRFFFFKLVTGIMAFSQQLLGAPTKLLRAPSSTQNLGVNLTHHMFGPIQVRLIKMNPLW